MKIGSQDGEKAGVACCFCNQGIIITHVDPCDISIMTNWDKPHRSEKNDQFFWCHLECFRSKLHENVRPYLCIDILAEQDE